MGGMCDDDSDDPEVAASAAFVAAIGTNMVCKARQQVDGVEACFQEELSQLGISFAALHGTKEHSRST